jgi:hypothetical protein
MPQLWHVGKRNVVGNDILSLEVSEIIHVKGGRPMIVPAKKNDIGTLPANQAQCSDLRQEKQ